MFSKKDLQRLIIPLIFEQILAVFMGMADTVMVASCSEAAVSGVSLIDGVNLLLLQVFAALATGGSIVVSQYLGKRDIQNAKNSSKQLVFATVIIAIVISVICIVFRIQIISTIFGKLDPEVFASARTYFLITAMGYPFISLFNAGAALFRAIGNAKLSLKCSLMMNGLNVIGNAILIYGFNMGVAGAAIATTISNILGAFFMIYMITHQDTEVRIDSFRHYRFDLKTTKKIFVVGIPSGLENGIFQIGKLLTASLMASFGTVSITANAIGNNISNLACIPEMAIGLAMITVVGRCVGAKEYEQARYYTKYLMKIAFIGMLIVNVGILCLSSNILSIYNLSSETFQLAMEIVIIYCISAIFLIVPAFGLPNALRAAGDVKYTMITSVIVMWSCRIGLSYLFSLTFGLGLVGVWVAMICDWGVRSIFFIIRFKGNHWLTKAVI
ncbi:MAG: MATE family efflux transporter [Anaerorhabdus sp.]|uniref:MATE family efflux transporter n=1 Tax=Anaerorhabdus sp. TaxID=1872524 RepID=UPI003A8A1167